MKLGRILFLSLLTLVGLFILWWNAPVSLKYSKEIWQGNQIIKKVATYQKENSRLPENNDWDILSQLGFNSETAYPAYNKLDDQNYSITYIEGFDSPYLTWSSKQKKWQKVFPPLQD